MTRKVKILLSLVVLIAAALACDYLPSPGPSDDAGDAIATSVAATLAAAESSAPDEGSPPESLEPEAPAVLKVAFVKDGDAWYWEEGTAPVSLTALGDVVEAQISNDGQVIALVRQYDWNNQEIYAVNSDGSDLRTLVSLADFSGMVLEPDAISAVPYRVAWVPGTHILAFNTRLTYEGPGLVLPDELRLVDADSGALSILLAPGSGGDFYYSPDGSQIALSTGTLISVVSADGTSFRDLLTFPMVITYSEYIYYPRVTWSADGSYLRAVIPPHDPLADPPEITKIWHLPADGTPPSSLLNLSPVPFFQEVPSLSPDLAQAAYLSVVSTGSPPVVDLHIAQLDGSSDVVYASGPYSFSGWSPDNEHFIYTENGNYPRIGRVGDSPIDFTGVTLMTDLSWVDEERFLYLNRLTGSWELWLGDLGAPASLIASTTGDRISFSFVR